MNLFQKKMTNHIQKKIYQSIKERKKVFLRRITNIFLRFCKKKQILLL